MFRWLEKQGRKRAGMIAIFFVITTLMTTAIIFAPAKTAEQVQEAKSGDLFSGLLNGFAADNVTGSGVIELQVRYTSGSLENLGETKVDNADGNFGVSGTSPTGDAASFQLFCGTKVCASKTNPFSEPATYWIVTVPLELNPTKLTITAGTALLDVEFE